MDAGWKIPSSRSHWDVSRYSSYATGITARAFGDFAVMLGSFLKMVTLVISRVTHRFGWNYLVQPKSTRNRCATPRYPKLDVSDRNCQLETSIKRYTRVFYEPEYGISPPISIWVARTFQAVDLWSRVFSGCAGLSLAERFLDRKWIFWLIEYTWPSVFYSRV